MSLVTSWVPEDPNEDDEPAAELQPEPSDSADLRVELDPLTGTIAIQGTLSGRHTGTGIAITALAATPIAALWVASVSGLPPWAVLGATLITVIITSVAIVRLLRRQRR